MTIQQKNIKDDPYSVEIVGTPRTYEEAEILVRQIELEEKALTEKKELVKKFFNANPQIKEVRGQSLVYSYPNNPQYKVEPHRIVDTLKFIAKNNENPYEYVNISIPKLLKQEWFNEELAEQFAVKTYSKRFQSSKI
ncbi:hypothetical protein ABD87_22790 [Lysinibacillus sphaericus]|uniref:hypothetical protein n=1 Tax=Lysinibacillus sphaericus TaxID=1421 RepID=UPI0018CF5A57|nr:hypothetical protein [Lysinibacillus sphaericus]MBG9732255.1 hypothetical protein [Lysinibacillus sphaericus]